ncbi:hypothetical protein [Octadecabacter sp. R77987]|uniref:hypothetical protein n=1 Tax=Octadecabacter sp. R77987 TaxID=3093874 RepID=UPI00366BEDBE
MIKLRVMADDDPVFEYSRLLRENEFAYGLASSIGGTRPTLTKFFNTNFAQWMKLHSPWLAAEANSVNGGSDLIDWVSDRLGNCGHLLSMQRTSA